MPAIKGISYTLYTSLTSQADTKLFQSNPTLAAGDVKVSKDGGAFNNLGTLPDAEPNAGSAVRVILSDAEMNADRVVVLFHDAAGAEWCDQLIAIDTGAIPLDTTGGFDIWVQSPLDNDGVSVTTVQGDDYLAADGREIEWTVATTATLAGGTIAVVVDGVASFAGSIINETTVRLDLTDIQTLTITKGMHDYSVILTDAGTHYVTLVRGKWNSRAQHTA